MRPYFPLRKALGVSVFIFGSAASLILGGCGTGGENSESHAALPTTLSSAFDPCTSIPGDVLESVRLQPEGRPTPARVGGAGEQYKGCEFRTLEDADPDRGPDVHIQVTNITMSYYETNFRPGRQFRAFRIDGRDVATAGEQGDTYCSMLIGLRSGGVKLSTTTSKNDSCQVLTDVATAVVPHIPQDA
ncbi:DUF3558 family protein [Nocardia nova]|uniref:DUF3558 family protein n=1 Tax=Nocardia nova TaxID=37330 RepID=UPI0015E31687